MSKKKPKVVIMTHQEQIPYYFKKIEMQGVNKTFVYTTSIRGARIFESYAEAESFMNRENYHRRLEVAEV